MNKNLRIILISAVAAVLGITVIGAVFGFFAYTRDFDYSLFYFNKGSVSALLTTALPFAAAAVSVALSFILRGKASFADAPGESIPLYFASIVTGCLIISSAFIPGGVGEALVTVDRGLFVTVSLLTGIYFILSPFPALTPGFKDPLSIVMTVLSFSPSLFVGLMLVEEYFRTGEPLNSPIRTANLAMYALLLLYFAEDIRFAIGKARPASYYFCLLTAFAFTGAATLPKLVLILTGAEGFSFVPMEWFICAAILMFMLSRLYALPRIIAPSSPADTGKAADTADTADSL